jgi:hypothetical protein
MLDIGRKSLRDLRNENAGSLLTVTTSPGKQPKAASPRPTTPVRMYRIAGYTQDRKCVLVEEEEMFYHVTLWPDDPDQAGLQQVFPYEPTETATSEMIAEKWGPWACAIPCDANNPAPEEIAVMVEKAFSAYKAGLRGELIVDL